MKKIISTLLAVLMVVVCFGACQSKDVAEDVPAVVSDFDYIKDNGKLVIGITDYAPMNYLDDANEWTGFDTEFAQAVCEKLGVEAEFVEIEWESKFISLKAKDIDCIWNGMTISEEVLNNTSCSDAYARNAQVVVVKADKAAEYTDAESMKDLTFAVEAGSAGAAAAEENNFANVVEVVAQSDALLEVVSGSADACIIDLTMANAMIGEGTSYDNLAKSIELTEEEYGIGFRKDSDLTAKVNELMVELTQDGTLPALAEKYDVVLAKGLASLVPEEVADSAVDSAVASDAE